MESALSDYTRCHWPSLDLSSHSVKFIAVSKDWLLTPLAFYWWWNNENHPGWTVLFIYNINVLKHCEDFYTWIQVLVFFIGQTFFLDQVTFWNCAWKSMIFVTVDLETQSTHCLSVYGYLLTLTIGSQRN